MSKCIAAYRFDQSQFDRLDDIESWNKWRQDNHKEQIWLEGADFKWRNLEGAKLSGAHLRGADLSNALLENIKLRYADLRDTNLTRASLKRATLYSSNLKGADLLETNLISADLRECKGLQLDYSIVRNALFSHHTNDLWSILRRTYTGPRLVTNLVIFAAFLLPYTIKAFFWTGIKNLQDFNHGVLTQLGTVNGNDNIRSLAKCLSSNCEEYQIWQLMIGFDNQAYFWLLSSVLITYNLSKISLTWLISPLREEEERSGYSPRFSYRPAPKSPNLKKVPVVKHITQTYGWMKWPHRIVTGLFWVALLAFTFNSIVLLTDTVAIPMRV